MIHKVKPLFKMHTTLYQLCLSDLNLGITISYSLMIDDIYNKMFIGKQKVERKIIQV